MRLSRSQANIPGPTKARCMWPPPILRPAMRYPG
jgi:hypothetical protein